MRQWDHSKELYDILMDNHYEGTLQTAREMYTQDLSEDQRLALWVEEVEALSNHINAWPVPQWAIERCAEDLFYYWESEYPGSEEELKDLDRFPTPYLVLVM